MTRRIEITIASLLPILLEWACGGPAEPPANPPKIDGWQVMYEMERDATLASVPVCVLSAVPDHAPPHAVCVLGKPINLPRLLSTIAERCGAHAKRQ